MKNILRSKYDNCIHEFVKECTCHFKNDLVAIILQGGLVREQIPTKSWSDIDLILIFKGFNKGISRFISSSMSTMELKYNIRLDINLVYIEDLIYYDSRVRYYNSEIINVLKRRSIKILFGTIDKIIIEKFDEREAVYIYLTSTISLFRRYYIENIYRSLNSENCKIYLQRIIRWVFSIIRSSLRIREVYVNPYDESLSELIRLKCISDKDELLLRKLIEIRKTFDSLNTYNIEYYINIFSDIESFTESYVRQTLHRQ
jgi:hypothetical protein